MKPLRKKPKTREEWLSLRKSGIGASESAAVVGLSPWMTASELYEIKTGLKQARDLSDNEEVSRGVRMEKPLRELYKSQHPDYKVVHHPYDMLYQKERPWMFATLDGEVKDSDKHSGVLEIKTASPNGKAGWAKWNEQIPEAYMAQILHQLICSGYDFVDLFAALINREDDMTIRTYHFERADLEEDMAWLLEKETEFWNNVQNQSVPPLTFVF